MDYTERQISTGAIEGLILLEPSCYQDFRGYYWTIYNDADHKWNFNHDKATVSKRNVLRGIHGDFKTVKMISCIHGEVYCVVVDKRPQSETYNEWRWTMLNHTNRKSIIIPPGVGLAYLVMSREAAMLYKLSYEGAYVDASSQFTYRWNDPEINIYWPINKPILQQRDA